jgi:hypothetical protein
MNGPTANSSTANGTTASSTVRERRRAGRTGWELPQLIRPLPVRRSPRNRTARVLPHFVDVVAYVHESRFATRDQIQRRFPQCLGVDRTARYQLASLVRLGYLATMPVTSTSPNFPLVYCATPHGIRFVKKAFTESGEDWDGVATETIRTRGSSLPSLLHELLITEFDLMVLQTVRRSTHLERLFVERRYFRREKQLRYEERGKLHRVVPDSGFLVRVSGNSESRLLNFVELDNGTMSVARLREKYERYDAWSRTVEAQEYLAAHFGDCSQASHRPTFRLLMIAHSKGTGDDDRRLLDLLLPALELPASMRDRIWLTTASKLAEHQHDRSPLLAPLWLRARDTRAWINDYRQFVADLPRGRGHRHLPKQRGFILSRISDLPKHAVLSSAESPT